MKPIIFSTPMVKAILEGRKSQTRRIIKSRHESGLFRISRRISDNAITSIESLDWDERNCEKDIICPYGKVGDILYVRETYVKACLSEDGEGPVNGEGWKYWYKADDEWTKHDWHNPNIDGPVASPRWKPSIHMPKEAARLFLKITDIRVERLQDIKNEDAIAEGIEKQFDTYLDYLMPGDPISNHVFVYPTSSFKSLWQKINGEESWDENPWVWVINFERIEKPL